MHNRYDAFTNLIVFTSFPDLIFAQYIPEANSEVFTWHEFAIPEIDCLKTNFPLLLIIITLQSFTPVSKPEIVNEFNTGFGDIVYCNDAETSPIETSSHTEPGVYSKISLYRVKNPGQ